VARDIVQRAEAVGHARSVVRADPAADVAGYLARLGVPRPERPDAAWLSLAHRAHMARVPYENLEIQLERTTSVDPVEAIARIVRGRGGYCFHLNGAFGLLLACLGYQVTRHLADVRGQDVDEAAAQDAADAAGATGVVGLASAGGVVGERGAAESAKAADGAVAAGLRTGLGAGDDTGFGAGRDVSHQALKVRCAEGEEWFVDCGLGDAPYEPMPLRVGESVQGPFTYRLEPWAERPGGWRFVHDPKAGSFSSMVFAPEPVDVEAFAAAHRRLSTSPDSGFVRSAVVGRRDAFAKEVLRGRVFTRIDAAGRSERTIETRGEWFALLADVFGLHLREVDGAARERLWARVSAEHEKWLAGSRPAWQDASHDATRF